MASCSISGGSLPRFPDQSVTFRNVDTIVADGATYPPITTVAAINSSGAMASVTLPCFAAGGTRYTIVLPAGNPVPAVLVALLPGTYTLEQVLSAALAVIEPDYALALVTSYAEPRLGNPSVNGYVLSSTAAGVRSWVAQSGGGGGAPSGPAGGDLAGTYPNPTLATPRATQAALDAEAATRSSADTTNANAISAETTARASADSAHAALTTSAHGGLVASSDARLSDARTPTAHKTTHATGGSDVLTPADIGAATSAAFAAHTGNTSNPHGTTAAQVGALAAASNLSDLASASAARGNLGLGSAATQAASAFDAAGAATSAVSTHNADTSAHGQTAAGRSVLTAADYAAMRTLLSLGTAAQADTGTATTNVPTKAQADTLYQPLDADLTAIAALTTTSYGRSLLTVAALNAADIADASANGRSLITAANYAAMRSLLGLVIGTNVQAYDTELAALAGLTSAADQLPYFTGSGTAALTTLSAFLRTLLDDADAVTARATLGAAQLVKKGRIKTGGVPYYSIPGIVPLSTTTRTLAGTRQYYEPFLVETPITIDQVAIEVVTAGSAGNTLRLGLYALDTDFAIGALNTDWGTVAADTVGVKTVGTSLTLQPGLYAGAVVSDGAPVVRTTRGYMNMGVSLGVSGNGLPTVLYVALGSYPSSYPTTPVAWTNNSLANSNAFDWMLHYRISVP